ncbi:lysophospholipid acyltransferase family protein [Campylobacter geochelonis]|uniref:lysophospholipid acyltransferase family protein n=1 Tax=Campylobacter geochelonis TaxID=1780362 RepID=UPI00077088E5|nr:lysophospholipid acyltransferase family protein [Campylobacter geochelonis]CZE51350.1 acyltransferase [Campylobacter geochelonis]
MKEKIEYFLVLLLMKFVKFAPVSFIYWFFDKLGLIMFSLLKSRKKIAISNLKAAFKDLSDDEIEKIAKDSFRSITRCSVECFLLINNKIDIDSLFDKPFEYEKEIREIMKDSQNGIIFFTAHFGNWEIASKYVAKLGFPQLVISREGNNALIEENITSPFRAMYDNELAYKHEAMSKIVKHLKKGGIIGILTDLKASGANSVLIPFFGRECHTVKTIGSLYMKYNPKIVPFFTRRLENGKYEIILEEFPKIALSGDKDKDVKDMVQICNNIYERVIRKSPEQWFWMHNRWKMD